MCLDQAKPLEDIKINKSVLVTSNSNMKEDDPTLVVQWNFDAFNANRSRDTSSFVWKCEYPQLNFESFC